MELKDFTQQKLNGSEEQGAGTYRLFPVFWALEEAKSGAACIRFTLAVHSKWIEKDKADDSAFSEKWPTGYYCEHRAWIFKKPTDEQKAKGETRGDINEGAVASLAECGLWDGDFDKLAGPPPNKYIVGTVEGEEYKGKVEYRCSWVNPDTDRPEVNRGFKPTDSTLLASMRQRFGSSMRAIAGGSTSGPVPSPPKSAPAATPGLSGDTDEPGIGNELTEPASGDSDDPIEVEDTPF